MRPAETALKVLGEFALGAAPEAGRAWGRQRAIEVSWHALYVEAARLVLDWVQKGQRRRRRRAPSATISAEAAAPCLKDMAVSAGPSCEPHRMGFGPGALVLLRRGEEYEEVLLAAPQGAGGTWVARTTSEDGSRFSWVLVRLRLGAFWVPVLTARGERQCPPGVISDSVNWVCEPPEATQQWRPAGPLLRAVVTEGEAVAHMLGHYGVDERYVFVAGSDGEPVDLADDPPGGRGAGFLPVAAAGGGPVQGLASSSAPKAGGPSTGQVPYGGCLPGANAAGPVAGALTGSGAAAAAASGGGLADHLGPMAMDPPMELSSVHAAILELKRSAEKGDRTKSRKKDKKGRRRKSRRRRRRDSSSGSSSARSRSSSSSRSSRSTSRDRKSRPLRWEYKDKRGKHRVEAGELHALEGQKFKKSGDLVSYAASNPGALSAYFLSAVYAKLCSGQVTQRRHLKDVSVAAWAPAIQV